MSELKLTKEEVSAVLVSVYSSICRNNDFLESISCEKNMERTIEVFEEQNSLLNSAYTALLVYLEQL